MLSLTDRQQRLLSAVLVLGTLVLAMVAVNRCSVQYASFTASPTKWSKSSIVPSAGRTLS
jgi:hypothetical protein